MNTLFLGTCTALITPFNKNGVDFANFEKQIERQLSNKIKTLAVCTTTGETPTLTDFEYKQVIEFAVNVINKRATVIVGTGSNCTKTAISNSIFAEKAGADGLLVVTPYYNKCTQNGIVKYYTDVAESVKIPVIAYNVPSRTGVNILPETMQKISLIPNVIGIKEASGDLQQVKRTIKLTRGNAKVYCGDDTLYYDFLKSGASGCISAVSNVFPKEFDDIYLNYISKKYNRAKTIQHDLKELIDALYVEVNPIPVKYVLKLLKLDSGILRLPLTELEKEHKKLVKTAIFKSGVKL